MWDTRVGVGDLLHLLFRLDDHLVVEYFFLSKMIPPRKLESTRQISHVLNLASRDWEFKSYRPVTVRVVKELNIQNLKTMGHITLASITVINILISSI